MHFLMESVVSWEDLAKSISDTKDLTVKQNFDSLYFKVFRKTPYRLNTKLL